jgi:hypothetical protein
VHKKSLTENYLTHFGDRRHQFIDIVPEIDTPFKLDHCSLMDNNLTKTPTDDEIAAMSQYVHTCWCNPELIYADDLKGNEVWLHKPPQ